MKKFLAFVVMAMTIAMAAARIAEAKTAPVAECVDEVISVSFDGYEAAKRNGHYLVEGVVTTIGTIGSGGQAAAEGDWEYWSPEYYNLVRDYDTLGHTLDLVVAYRPRQEVLDLGRELRLPRGFLF